MTDKNWTPGPWSVRDEGFGEVVDSKGRGVADTAVDMQANAHLVSAAPEMYEALEGLVDWLDGAPVGEGYERANEARDALAKARGDG